MQAISKPKNPEAGSIEAAPGVTVNCSNCKRVLSEVGTAGRYWCWRCGCWSEAKANSDEVK